MKGSPKVFISYSHDNDAHKSWTHQLGKVQLSHRNETISVIAL